MPGSKPGRYGSLADRFVAKTRKSPSGCVEWQASRGTEGYGQISISTSRATQAHRVSFELFVGPIPAGLHVLHRCDNRLCVSPTHLFLGTNLDNIHDMIGKERHHHGETHFNAKLTRDDITKILQRLEHGETQQSIADDFGVCRAHIGSIGKGIIWKHLTIEKGA